MLRNLNNEADLLPMIIAPSLNSSNRGNEFKKDIRLACLEYINEKMSN